MLTALRLRMIAMAITILAMLTMTATQIWNGLVPHTPIENIQSLDGCYDSAGSLPDFIRPPRHWTLRLVNGTMINRADTEIAKIRLGVSSNRETRVAFSPGIVLGDKPLTVRLGQTVTGTAYRSGGRVTIVLANEQRQMLLKSSCS